MILTLTLPGTSQILFKQYFKGTIILVLFWGSFATALVYIIKWLIYFYKTAFEVNATTPFKHFSILFIVTLILINAGVYVYAIIDTLQSLKRR